MCEILGFSAKKEQPIERYLREFYQHSKDHPDGWGLALFREGDSKLYTEPTEARFSEQLPGLLDFIGVQSCTLAHIRKATVGGINPKNCHPFQRTDNSGIVWTLVHNGTIFSGLELFPYESCQEGTTDSERVLLYLVDRMNEAIQRKGAGLHSFERFKVLEQVVSTLSYRNKLNLLIYDGEQLYVHTNMLGTLFQKQWEDSALFSTTPLDETHWEQVPMTTVLVYQDGTLRYKGRDHHTVYVDTLNDSTMPYDYEI